MMQVRPDVTRGWRASRGSPRRRRLAVFAVPITICGLAVALAGPASAAPAAPQIPNAPNITIFLTNATSYCADVKNSVNKAGTAIWLYKCSAGKSEHWYEIGGRACGVQQPTICTEFIDVRNTSLCLAMNANRNVVLQNCGVNGSGPPVQSLWVVHTGPENGWRSAAWGGMGDLAVASDKQGDLLHGLDVSAGECNGCWYHWTES
jgi:hypothetical protein